MNTLNELFRRVSRTLLAPAALACALPLTIPAQNLLPNPGFENAAPGVPAGTTVSYTAHCQGGKSAAAVWLVWVNSCRSDIATTLVPSTAPNGDASMIHVVTDGANNGIYTHFSSQPQTLASAWVFVNHGCVGMGTGNGPETGDTDEMTCVTGRWIRFYKVPNGVSPGSEFVIYSVQNPALPSPTGGADFYVDNAKVVADPNPALPIAAADAAGK